MQGIIERETFPGYYMVKWDDGSTFEARGGRELIFQDPPQEKKAKKTEELSEEAKFLRHLKNLGHEDVESSALERGGRWETAAKDLQAHESRS